MKKALFPVVLLLSMALLIVLGSVSVEAKCGPKEDNWIAFVDQSGSMYMTYWKVSGKDSKVIGKKGGVPGW